MRPAGLVPVYGKRVDEVLHAAHDPVSDVAPLHSRCFCILCPVPRGRLELCISESRACSVAPVVVLFGYGFILYGIMSKGSGTKELEVLKA